MADARLLRALPRIAIASALMGAVLLAAAAALGDRLAATGIVERFGALAVLVATGLAVYAVAAFGLGVVTPRQLLGQLRRNRPGGAA